MNRIHPTCRLAGILAGLAGALVAFAAASPAAFATQVPPPGGDGGTAPAKVHTIVTSGMPGWQITLVAATSVAATGQRVALDDPVGDGANNLNTEGLSNNKGPAYLDLVHVEMAKDGTNFVMTMRLASPVPVMPDDPPGTDGVYAWWFALDTQPESPAGYPLSNGATARPEYLALLTWDGSTFHGSLVDRTPLLVGGEAVVTDIPFSFNGARDEVTFVVDQQLAGNPAEFSWYAATGIREAHFGSSGFQAIDRAPDTGFANWP